MTRTYYKLVSDGVIVDAICAEEAKWIEENHRNHSLYVGLAELSYGVEASDQSRIWHIAGRPTFHAYPDFVTVDLIDVSKAEYDVIMEELEAEREKEDSFTPEDEVPPGQDAKTRIQLLEERIDALIAENEMLVECLLEMSEIVYG